MDKIKNKGLKAALLALIVCIGIGIILYKSREKEAEDNKIAEELFQETSKGVDIWIPYWGMNAVGEDMEAIADSVDELCYFAAYFDENKQLFVEDTTKMLHERYGRDERFQNKKSYITIVNDVKTKDGDSISKDTQILRDILATDESTDDHVKDIISLAKSMDFNGIEIDYEAIRGDTELWERFVLFENELIDAANEANLSVRIVLEPAFPIDGYNWSSECEYVLMCYNLYGKGTEPGPRATYEFLEQMVSKLEKMPGKKNFALATGGYDFCDDGVVKGITRLEAEKLFELNPGDAPQRDEESGQLHFGYIDENEVIHYVWYSDNETIEKWMETIHAQGYDDFTLFRAGAM